MPLHTNNQLLISTLEAMPLLDGRYEGMKFVNYNSLKDEKRGCFSLVFRAFDRLNQKTVALKFYDIDPQRMMDIYRQQSFQREHEILTIRSVAFNWLQGYPPIIFSFFFPTELRLRILANILQLSGLIKILMIISIAWGMVPLTLFRNFGYFMRLFLLLRLCIALRFITEILKRITCESTKMQLKGLLSRLTLVQPQDSRPRI